MPIQAADPRRAVHFRRATGGTFGVKNAFDGRRAGSLSVLSNACGVSAYPQDSGLLGVRITPGGYQRFAYLFEL